MPDFLRTKRRTLQSCERAGVRSQVAGWWLIIRGVLITTPFDRGWEGTNGRRGLGAVFLRHGTSAPTQQGQPYDQKTQESVTASHDHSIHYGTTTTSPGWRRMFCSAALPETTSL